MQLCVDKMYSVFAVFKEYIVLPLQKRNEEELVLGFADKLRDARVAKGYTQEQLAEKLGVTRQSVSKWESGQGMPEAETLPFISDVLEVSLDVLLKDSSTYPQVQDTSMEQGAPLQKDAVQEREYQNYMQNWEEKRIRSSRNCLIGVVIMALVLVGIVIAAAFMFGTIGSSVAEKVTTDVHSMNLYFPVSFQVFRMDCLLGF